MAFLPVSRKDMESRGWNQLDFLFISGDAYIDHPSFGAAIIMNLLEKKGYRTGIIAQPDINDKQSLLLMGKPRLGVLISSGVVDSMVNNYTAAKKRRSDDRYSPGGKGGKRPDRCLIKYSDLARRVFGDTPLIIGGVDASLRRLAHYDYWSEKVRRSILQDSKADILVYGMGEKAILRIAELLEKGVNVKKINSIEGTCVFLKPEDMTSDCREFALENNGFQYVKSEFEIEDMNKHPLPENEKFIMLPSYEEVQTNKTAYIKAFRSQFREQVPGESKTLLQKHSEKFIVHNPPGTPLAEKELDEIYSLDFERDYHPSYISEKGVPAISEVKFSITSHRGCFGGCNFCAITFHQGKIVRHRSIKSIVNEAEIIAGNPDFKGYIHDVGGPTANFYEPACDKQKKGSYCKDRSCLFPEICPNLKISHKSYSKVLDGVKSVKGIKKVFIRSGIRYDYIMHDKKGDFLTKISRDHISGQLKVAPEHTSRKVLDAMGKPSYEIYEDFKKQYTAINNKLGKKQYLVPYLISGHPGSTIHDAVEMAVNIKKNRVMPEQVQDFYPTPGTVSTTMYYTGIDPFTLERVHVPGYEEKRLQRALLRFSDPKNAALVIKALRMAKREDLIGYDQNCLVKPRAGKYTADSNAKTHSSYKGKRKNISNTGGNENDKNNKRKRNVTGSKGRNKRSGKGSKGKIR